MRRTRFMSLVFLVLAVAFFFVPEFRQALQAPVVGLSLAAGSWDVLERAGRLPQEQIEAAAREGEEKRDARKLAFAALKLAKFEDRARRADQVVALDPQYTWIYFTLLMSERKAPQAEEWARKLKAWDPENAVPYLLEAERINEAKDLSRHVTLTPQAAEALAAESEWRRAMEKGFAAPRFDGYIGRRFDFERAMFRELGLAQPTRVVFSLATYPIVNLLNLRQYSNLLILRDAKNAEDAGRPAEAADICWKVAHFGERMELGARATIEKLIAYSLQLQAYQKLQTLLRRMNRVNEAAMVEFRTQDLRRQLAIGKGDDPISQSSNYNWAALNLAICGVLVTVFGAVTVFCVLYVNAKRWIRPAHKGRLYLFVTVAENYLPILFFLSCLGLFLSFAPYAQNFRFYMSAPGEIFDFEPFTYNALPVLGAYQGRPALPVENPFRTYAWYALGGLALVVMSELIGRTRGKPPA